MLLYTTGQCLSSLRMRSLLVNIDDKPFTTAMTQTQCVHMNIDTCANITSMKSSITQTTKLSRQA